MKNILIIGANSSITRDCIKIWSKQNNKFFFVARDIPHNQRKDEPWSWVDWTTESTILTSDMHRGYVVPDGWDEVHFNRGATITVNTDAPRLCLLTFRNTLSEKLEQLSSKV